MKKIFTLLLFVSVLFCSCKNLFNSGDSSKQEPGTVTINLSREEFNPRTINAEGLHSFNDVKKWNVTFTPASGSEGLKTVEETVSLVDSSCSFSLLPGIYDVTLKGNVLIEDEAQLYYAGYTTITVEQGENAPVTIYVGLQKEAGETSSINYTIDLGNDISIKTDPVFKVVLENRSDDESEDEVFSKVAHTGAVSVSASDITFDDTSKKLNIFLKDVPSAYYRMSIYYVDGATEYKFVLTDNLLEVSKGAWIFVADAVSIGTLTSRIYYATESSSDFNGVAPAYPANLTSLLTKLSQANDWHYARIIMQNIPDMSSEEIQTICAGIQNRVDITVKTEDEIYRIENGVITFNLDYALDEAEDGGVVEVAGTWSMSSGVRTVRNVTIKAPEGKTLTLERGASFVDKSMIEVPEGKTLTLENVVLDGKAVSFGSAKGGAVNVSGSLVMNNCILCNHRGSQNDGAALYIASGADVEMNDTDIYNCVANNSPIYLMGNFVMNSGNIYGCGSGTSGGAFKIMGGCLTMNDGLIGGEGNITTITGEECSRGNTATEGAAVFISNTNAGSKFIMNGGTIAYNSASGYGGGGVYISGSSVLGTMEFNGGTIAHNELRGTSSVGGDIYVSGTLKISDSSILDEDTDIYMSSNYANVVVPYGQVETYRAAFDGNENIVEVACNVDKLSEELGKITDSRFADNPVYVKILDTNPDLTVLNAALKAKSGLHCDLNMRLCTGLTTFAGTESEDTQTAFDELRYLVGISLPSKVTSIGDFAFTHCTSLERISMPTGITSIGDHAFYFCSSLGSLDLPNVTSVGDSAFAYSSVTSVKFSNKLTSIANAAFDHAEILTSIEIPEAITKLEYTFRGTSALNTVIINSDTMDLAAGAFSGSSVKKIVFKGTSLTIGGGDAVFTGCSNVKLIAAKKSYLPDLSSNATLSAIITTYGATDTQESDTDITLSDGSFISEEGYALLKDYFDIETAGFVRVAGTSITGSETWTPESKIFISGRQLTIPDLIVCDHEVTRGEYKELIGTDPSTAKAYGSDGNLVSGDAELKHPVNYVNWYEALVYCNKLSIKEGLAPCYTISGSTNPEDWGTAPTSSDDTWNAVTCDFSANGYRLPTEAEWEWLARGGENYTYAGSNTVNDVAWYKENSNSAIDSMKGTREVKTKNANGYGLYDMSGNVWEYCWDWYVAAVDSSVAAEGPVSGTDRIKRGGSINGDAAVATCTYRDHSTINRNSGYGFRVVRTAE